jgi:hypothetical protein
MTKERQTDWRLRVADKSNLSPKTQSQAFCPQDRSSLAVSTISPRSIRLQKAAFFDILSGKLISRTIGDSGFRDDLNAANAKQQGAQLTRASGVEKT